MNSNYYDHYHDLIDYNEECKIQLKILAQLPQIVQSVDHTSGRDCIFDTPLCVDVIYGSNLIYI